MLLLIPLDQPVYFETSRFRMPSFRTSSSFARAPWPVLVESDHDVTNIPNEYFQKA
jgi:hypothetical protein